jgi:predicted RNA binding protein YcfA (HicA-like mRNA interferase family)
MPVVRRIPEKPVPEYNDPVAGKTLQRVLSGTSDASIRFDDLCTLLENLGFQKRVKGSHHIFRKAGVEEKVNLQRDGNNAKPYQVKQVRAVLLKYKFSETQ